MFYTIDLKNKTKQKTFRQSKNHVLFVAVTVLAMAEKRRLGYSVHRDILNEEAVDEMAEKSDSKPPLSEKVKKAVR